jgi:hypothetical protein
MPGRLPTEREDVDSLAGITSQQAQDVLKAAAPTADKPALEQAAQAVQATAQGKPFPSAERQASQPTKITWIYAVNLATDPDWAQLAVSGTGLVIAEDDPDAARLASLARAYGIPVAINVATKGGETPEAYAGRVAAANTQYKPDRLVLDIETPGYGYSNSDPRHDPNQDGWNWSTKAASLIQTQVGASGVGLTVTTEPNKEDFNYGVWDKAGADFWIQSYRGDMSPVDPKQATGWALASGVDPAKVTALLAPNQSSSGLGKVAYYGMPTTGQPGFPGVGPPEDVPTPPGSPGGGPSVGSPGSAGGEMGETGSGAQGGPGGDGTPDWAQVYFGTLGLPPDAIKTVDAIFAKYPTDPQTAILLSQQFIRTTPWFANNFPGFFNGLKAGLFGDENGYRQYVNQVNNYSMQYFNRPVATGEIEAYLTAGYDPNFVGKLYDSTLIQNTQAGEFQYELGAFGEGGAASASELNALAGQSAGINSQIGARMAQRLQQAHTRMLGMFQGSLASPQLSLGNQGLNAPSLAGQKPGALDIPS